MRRWQKLIKLKKDIPNETCECVIIGVENALDTQSQILSCWSRERLDMSEDKRKWYWDSQINVFMKIQFENAVFALCSRPTFPSNLISLRTFEHPRMFSSNTESYRKEIKFIVVQVERLGTKQNGKANQQITWWKPITENDCVCISDWGMTRIALQTERKLYLATLFLHGFNVTLCNVY